MIYSFSACSYRFLACTRWFIYHSISLCSIASLLWFLYYWQRSWLEQPKSPRLVPSTSVGRNRLLSVCRACGKRSRRSVLIYLDFCAVYQIFCTDYIDFFLCFYLALNDSFTSTTVHTPAALPCLLIENFIWPTDEALLRDREGFNFGSLTEARCRRVISAFVMIQSYTGTGTLWKG